MYLRLIDECSCPGKDGVEHRLGQTAGERVLLTRMKRAQDRHRSFRVERTGRLDAVPELRFLVEGDVVRSRVVCELTKCDYHAKIHEQRQLAVEEWATGIALGGVRLVPRRGASDGSVHVRVRKGQAVVRVNAGRLIREAGPMQRSKQPVPGSVAGEHTPRPVGAMGSGCQPKYQHRRFGVAEAGNGASPIAVAEVGSPLDGGHLSAPVHQPRTLLAGADVGTELGERIHRVSLARESAGSRLSRGLGSGKVEGAW